MHISRMIDRFLESQKNRISEQEKAVEQGLLFSVKYDMILMLE